MLVSFPEIKTFPTTQSSILVLIDPGVEDHQHLAEGVIEGAIAHILDPQCDGIEQITELLHQHPNYFSEIHIVSHGAPGCIHLGNGELSLSTLAQHKPQLKTWFSSYVQPTSSSLVFYGCNVAAGDAGEEFLTQLQQILGVAIAASSTITGPEHLGGNWKFEVSRGSIRPTPAFTPEALAALTHTLPVLADGFEQSTYLEGSWLGLTNKLTVDHTSGSLYLATERDSLYQVFPDKTRRVVIDEFEQRLSKYGDIQFYNGKIYGVMGTSGSLREVDLFAGTDIELIQLPEVKEDAGLAIHQGKIYISDGEGHADAIQVFDLETQELSTLVTGLDSYVLSVETDPISGRIYFSTLEGRFYQATPNEAGEPPFRLIAAIPNSNGKFAVDPNGQYLYATTNQGKIERIALADGSFITFAEGFGGVEEGDLAFAQSSNDEGLSLYVLSGDSRIEELSGFARPESGTDVAIPGLRLATRYEGDLDDARTLTVDPQTGHLYSISEGSLFQLSSDGTVTQPVDFLEFPIDLARGADIQFYDGSVYAYFGIYDGFRQLNPQEPSPQNPTPQDQGLVQFTASLPRGQGLDIAKGKIFFTEESPAGDRIRTFDLRTQELATLVDGLTFSPESLEIDPLSGNVYFSARGEFYVIDPSHWDGVENGYRSLRTSFLPTASGEFAIGPAGKYLYATSNDDKIWRIATAPEHQGTTGGPELVAEGLVDIRNRDLAFGPSSSPWGGSSLYVLGKDNLTWQEKVYEISGFDNPPLAKPLPNLDEDREDIPGMGSRVPRLTIDPTRRNFYAGDLSSLTLTSYFEDSLRPYLDSRMPYWRGQADFPLAGLSDPDASLMLTEQLISETEIQFYQGFVYGLTDDGSLRKLDPKTQTNIELGTLSDFGADAGIDVLNDKVYISDGRGRANEIIAFDLKSQSFETFLTDIPEDVSNVEVDAFNNLVYFSAWEQQEPSNSFKLSFYQAEPEGMGYRRVTQLNSFVRRGDRRLEAGAFTVGPRGEYLYTIFDNELHRIAIDTGLVQAIESDRGELNVGSFGDLTFAPSLNFNPEYPSYSLFVVSEDDSYELKGFDRERNGFPVPFNRLPELSQTIANQTIEENQPFSLVLPEDLFVDLDRDQPWLDITVFEDDQLPEWLTFDPVTRTLSGTPQHRDVVDEIPLSVNAWDRPGFRDEPDASIVFWLTVNDVNNPPIGEIMLSDTASEDVAIASTSTLEDADSINGPLRYQWEQKASNGWELIVNATNSSFTPDDAQVDKQLRLKVSYTDGGNLVETVYSQPTGAIANSNDAPTLAIPLADQQVVLGNLLNLTLPSNSFSDVDSAVDPDERLTYSAALINLNNPDAEPLPLPDWLSFDPATQTFSGDPTDAEILNIEVTATDRAGETVSDRFTLTLTEPPEQPEEPPVVQPPVIRDFNGDRTSDPLWRNRRTGALEVRLTQTDESGSTPGDETTDSSEDTTVTLGPVIRDFNWQVPTLGDFTGDGQPDLLWHNEQTGQLVLWEMNGTMPVGATALPAVRNRNWQLKGSGDLNGDQNRDLIWYDSETQAVTVWYLDRAEKLDSEVVTTLVGGDRLEAVGDFDGNGTIDLFLRNPETGQNTIQFLDGATLLSSVTTESLQGADWFIGGVGDYNSNGNTDLAWQNVATGERQLWLMDGASATIQNLETVSEDWTMVG